MLNIQVYSKCVLSKFKVGDSTFVYPEGMGK